MASGGVDHFGLIGQVLDGQFRVDGVLGEGGFSVVYKGHHLGLSEPIAIKCLKLPGALGSALVESFVSRFRDESRIHYRLSQGNLHIARSIASGTTMAPATSALVPFMVLEFLDGRSLAQELADRREQALHGRPLAEAVRFLDPAVDAIAYAHSQGVVHRDLNPGNFFITKTRDGVKLKVLDFGVAKVMSDHGIGLGPRAPTLGQIRIFSPGYGAPEQFDDKVGAIGPWTDVYALSLVALEVMTDTQVIDGEHIGELAMKTLNPDFRPTPRALGITVGDEVEQIFQGSLSIAPKARPQDAGQFWGMLKHAMRRDSEAGAASGATARAGAPPQLATKSTLMVGSISPTVERFRPGAPAPGSAPPTMRTGPTASSQFDAGSSPNTTATDAATSPGTDQGGAAWKSTMRMGSTPAAAMAAVRPAATVPLGVAVRMRQEPTLASQPAVAPQNAGPNPRLAPSESYDSSYGHRGEMAGERTSSRPAANVQPGGFGASIKAPRPGSSRPPPMEELAVPEHSLPRVIAMAVGVVLLGGLLGTCAWWLWFAR